MMRSTPFDPPRPSGRPAPRWRADRRALLARLAVASGLFALGGCTDAAQPMPSPEATAAASTAPPTTTSATAEATSEADAPAVADARSGPDHRVVLPSLVSAYPPPAALEGTDGGAADGATEPSAPTVPADAPTDAPAAGAACAGIVRRDGDRLVLDGQPVVFFGINVQYLLDPEFPERQVSFFLDQLVAREVNTLRVWFLHDSDPDRLERLLDAGRQRGLKFVVTLADHVFRDVDWFGGKDDEKHYRPHLVRTVERFKDRPEILMWELINEPSCGTGKYSADCAERIKGWLRSRAREVVAIDACHLVSTGMIGAGNYDEERDEFRRIHRDDAIQIVSAHRRVDEARDVTLDIANQLDRPIFYGEIYAKAHDEGCRALEGDDSPKRRAGRVEDDLADSLDDGVDGYLLWALAAGRIDTRDGEKYYCGVNDYELDDPLWATLAANPDLPPPVPWGPEP